MKKRKSRRGKKNGRGGGGGEEQTGLRRAEVEGGRCVQKEVGRNRERDEARLKVFYSGALQELLRKRRKIYEELSHLTQIIMPCFFFLVHLSLFNPITGVFFYCVDGEKTEMDGRKRQV